MVEYANRKSDLVESQVILQVRLLSQPPCSLIAWSSGWQPRWLHPVIRVLGEPKFWLVLLPGYWIARNLPWFPFTLLAPG